MTDISLAWDQANARADWAIVGGTIAVGGDLQSAVILSLFTDRLAPEDFPAQSGDRRGFWGDSFSATPWGSRLWTLERVAKSGATNLLRQAETYCREALQWMLDDGVASGITVAATWLNTTAIGLTITIAQPTGAALPPFQYSWAWAGV